VTAGSFWPRGTTAERVETCGRASTAANGRRKRKQPASSRAKLRRGFLQPWAVEIEIRRETWRRKAPPASTGSAAYRSG
jgi:hypothetical protein